VDKYDDILEEYNRYEMVVDSRLCKSEVLYTLEQEEFAALRENYMRTSNGLLIVYSIASRDSFSKVLNFFNWILAVKQGLIQAQSENEEPPR
jgi:GTPase KRas protein